MKRKTFAGSPCQIARSLDVLGDWWNPLILRECTYGVHRFDDFQQMLGIGRNMLTRRLKQLIEEGLLEKKAYQFSPERYEYRLTDKGFDAIKVLIAMMEFGEKWHFKQGKEPIRLYNIESGERVHPAVVDANTMETIDPRKITAGPGPGFPKNKTIRRIRFGESYIE
ncbi:MAG: winged helix-turn-helix transcriptional regulator [Granulosicoccus sp.]